MISTPTTGVRRRTTSSQWPELPTAPTELREDPHFDHWHTGVQSAWKDLLTQLDRAGVEGRDINVVNGGVTRVLNLIGGNNGSGGGRNRGTGTIVPIPGYVPGKGPLDNGGLPPGIHPSAEGGTYLIRLDGTRVFYQTVPPSEGREGDLWYDTDDLFKLYLFHNGKWTSVFDDIPSIEPTIKVVKEFDARTLLSVANAQAEALLQESKDRTAAIEELEEKISTATSSLVRRFQVLNAEVHSTAGLGAVYARITHEESVRAAADSAMATSITTVSVAVAAAAASVVTEQTARIAADGTISASLSSEVSARSAGDSSLSASITTEQTARIAADGTITSNLSSEVSARAFGDSLNSAAVITEQTARISSDNSLSAEYVLNVVTGGTSGRRVAGFRITNLGGAGGSTEMAIQVDKFVIVDTSGNIPTVPFKVTGGTVYIDRAVITEVTAGAILAGTISVALTLTAVSIIAGSLSASTITGGTISGTSFTGGSVAIGSGVNRFSADTSAGAVLGDPSGVNIKAFNDGSFTGLYIRSVSTTKAFLGVHNSTGIVTLDLGGGGSSLQNVTTVNAQTVKALSSSDPRTTDAPLYSSGGCWVERTLDVRGDGHFNANLFANGSINVNGGSPSFPGYSFNGDNNTGVYSDESDKVKLAAGGSAICRGVRDGSGNLYFILDTNVAFRIGNNGGTYFGESFSGFLSFQKNDGTTVKLPYYT
jgi:cell division septum initiation protein DivIVA